ncbi:MAG: carbohydrate deacetylase [Tetragenococcus koreensis]|uniref:Carbohydrate deacetylase n=1 Tax=Tetragenococcus halophilus TaxID=51669 RepID=A0AB35HLF5_TETHA|nr:carbohydrate deacetylase [Tetragenococcus halophilus]MDN6140500.1 carbohydrate deacetylase [Tetragenococcus koreensis]MDN6162134.1 carbohydrate deacetylase [Atopostipes sp.]MDN6571637.1 carbohydrate deacetylase [Staphylococcus equorum]MCF1684654.1 carbohydrate deacetylase [Tetragenococcus halophilus]MCO8297091.1 carbohydrate deacetylase [Tetragenococcus halophilus]
MDVLIINADDFGYSEGINLGIVAAHKKGILTSTTMLANMPGFEHGVELAQNYPNLGIGVHLTLTCGKPLLNDVPSISDNDSFHSLSFYEGDFSVNPDEVYREWRAQIEKILLTGIKPTHLDSHHHVNSFGPMKEIFIELAQKYNLPVRNNFDVPSCLKTTKKFSMDFDQLADEKEIWKPITIKNLIQDCKEYHSVECMCHPGFIDNVVLNNSGLRDLRAHTCGELQNEKYKEVFEENNIVLGNYRDI